MIALPVNPVDRSAWESVAGFLNDALIKGEGIKDWTLEDVRDMASQGQVNVWALIDNNVLEGAGVTTETVYPRRKVLEILLLGARTGSAWMKLLPVMKSLARAIGAQYVVGSGRPGWARKLGAKQRIHWEIEANE